MNAAVLAELLGGAARYKALRCLYEHADREYGTGELAAAAGIDPSNASRWLRRWADVGLLERRRLRGHSVYQASKEPALTPLRLLLQQDSETVSVLRQHLGLLEHKVVAAAVFGSAARGETHADSDIDLLLVTEELSKLEAQAHFKPAGRTLGRPVNVLVYRPEDWQRALHENNPLVLDILEHPTIVLKGALNAA